MKLTTFRRSLQISATAAAMSLFALTVARGAVAPLPGPSFDCDKARSAIEIMICSDATLGHLDGALGAAYAAKREDLAGAARKQLEEQQRAWLKRRLADCPVPRDPESDIIGFWKAEPCLAKMYLARIEALGRPAPNLPKGAAADIVPPLCFDGLDLFGETNKDQPHIVDLALCRAALAHVPLEDGAPGYLFQRRADYRWPAGSMGYRSIAHLPDGGWIVELQDNGGGTGWFSMLLLMRLEKERMIAENSIGFGDRCNGGLADAAHLGGFEVSAGVNITSLGLVTLADADGIADDRLSFGDLSDAAISCIGKADYRINVKTGDSTFTGVRIDQLDLQSGGDLKLQTCFNDLMQESLPALPGMLDAAAATTFNQDFAARCLQ